MPFEFEYNQSLSVIKGVGPKILSKLADCGLSSFRDALFHLPLRYEDKTKITPFSQAAEGALVLMQGVIKRTHFFKKNFWVEIEEASSTSRLCLIFFNMNTVQRNQFKTSRLVRAYGRVRLDGLKLCMQHPETDFISDFSAPLINTLLPIYPATQGLYQTHLRKIIASVLEQYCAYSKHNKLAKALVSIHHPCNEQEGEAVLMRTHPSCQYLIEQELLAFFLNLKNTQAHLSTPSTIEIAFNEPTQKIIKQFLDSLPFKLTPSQEEVLEQIFGDLKKNSKMMRLVQGDVGSGKTLIAGLSALSVLANGFQVACLAPTEILAFQLFQKFKAWFEPLGFECLFLSGSLSAKQKTQILRVLRTQEGVLVVGTHALFQESVEFNNLGLIIIDEQHRFGVHQRVALSAKALNAHELVMSATPIPRTLALTHYSNLALSSIKELPSGRASIKTVMMSEARRLEVIEKMHTLCAMGQQIYWLCTAIDESQACQSAQQSFALLQNHCAELKIGLIHGRLSFAEKEQIMQAYRLGEIQVLVATTVIEVGVDVPNATLMVIENPERLGLSQLHQLRGRVGRGVLQSFCILLYKQPLSESAKARLMVLRDSQDGFEIAEKDLELRGVGDFLGAKQSGVANFKIADWARDRALILKLAKVKSFEVDESILALFKPDAVHDEEPIFCA